MSGYYILDGHKAVEVGSLIEWALAFERTDRHVARTYFEDGTYVSTVFLGIDHGYGLDRPLLFETMVFDGNEDDIQVRYSTWEEAEAGHQKIVQEQAATRVQVAMQP